MIRTTAFRLKLWDEESGCLVGYARASSDSDSSAVSKSVPGTALMHGEVAPASR